MKLVTKSHPGRWLQRKPRNGGKNIGHADTAMIYKTNGRYIPNLTRQDGSALEKLVTDATK